MEESQKVLRCQKYEKELKLQQIFHSQSDLYRSTFEKSELGRIKKFLPLHEMAENFGLVSKSMRPKPGRKSYFTADGKVALMFLKILYIFFGVHTANVVQLADRIEQRAQLAAA